MGARQTDWDALGISNDFLFGKVMQDPVLCKGLLQRILPDLKIPEAEPQLYYIHMLGRCFRTWSAHLHV